MMCDLISEAMYDQLMDDIRDVIGQLEDITVDSSDFDIEGIDPDNIEYEISEFVDNMVDDVESKLADIISNLESIVQSTLEEKAQMSSGSEY